MRKGETDLVVLRMPVSLRNPDLTPYDGSVADPVIRIRIPGTLEWVLITNQELLAVTGGHAGSFDIQLVPAEVLVAGTARYAVEVGTAEIFEAYFDIDAGGPTLAEVSTWAVQGLHGPNALTRQSARRAVRAAITANWPAR